MLFLSQKTNIIFFFPLCKFPGIGKFTETEGKMMVTKIWAGRLGRCSLLGTYRVSVEGLENALGSGVWLHNFVHILKITESYTL